MPTYRKKPVVVEASQWFPGVDHPGVHSLPEGEDSIPPGATHYVTTIHGQRAYLAPGDFILPEPKEGHFYPCKPDVFGATYDLA